MHFSKTYALILESLPPELRENAIQYRQLKKLINQVVSELSSLGLNPAVLHELIADSPTTEDAEKKDPTSTSKVGVHHHQPDGGAYDNNNPNHDQSAPVQSPPASPTAVGNSAEAIGAPAHPKIVYELVQHADGIEPHLKFWVTVPDGPAPPRAARDKSAHPPHHHQQQQQRDKSPLGSTRDLEDEEDEEGDKDASPERDSSRAASQNLLWSLHEKLSQSGSCVCVSSGEGDAVDAEVGSSSDSGESPIPHIISPAAAAAASHAHSGRTQEVVIPLVSDTKFFNTLSSALDSVSVHLDAVHADFLGTLTTLSRAISESALPASASPSFHPHSPLTSHAGSIRVSTSQPSKSDLYSWREIFQLYVEAEVFEHVGEVGHGERSVEESEQRLKLFVEQATQRGLADSKRFKSKQSRQSLETFIELNLFILNIKKFSEASSEATRKILKKHTKRTALPLPSPFTSGSTSPSSLSLTIPPCTHSHPLHPHQPFQSQSHSHSQHQPHQPHQHLALFSRLTTASLPRTLVQALGETLLPIIPHVDDYACLICTGLAFKPIRLNCGHLFCVRCLVKMQKRSKGDCPMCRAPVVLTANRANVDWALVNFMQDWFPMEAREKLKANEKEAAEEELVELGLDPNQTCVSM